MADLIKSIGYDQSEIIRNILKLHVPEEKIDCYPTFSTGTFYTGMGIPLPQYRFDISPQRNDVVQADARHLPLTKENPCKVLTATLSAGVLVYIPMKRVCTAATRICSPRRTEF